MIVIITNHIRVIRIISNGQKNMIYITQRLPTNTIDIPLYNTIIVGFVKIVIIVIIIAVIVATRASIFIVFVTRS